MSSQQLEIPLIEERTTKPGPAPERFSLDEGEGLIKRHITRRDGSETISTVSWDGKSRADLAAAYDLAWLRSSAPPKIASAQNVRIADIFSGCGAMTLGVWEACRALNLNATPAFAVDINPKALEVFQANFPDCETHSGSVEEVLSEPGERLTTAERRLKKILGSIDVLVGGPPCQGHSDLNNHTRRKDPRNALLLKMVRCAEVLKPNHIVIENVPGILYDRDNVVVLGATFLEELGYSVDWGLIDARNLGVAQRRRRFFMIASKKTQDLSVDNITKLYEVPDRSFGWACSDLMDVTGNNELDSMTKTSPLNARRIEYLFENDTYDLPDDQRPDCHKDKPHSYKSVYGRLYWEKPAQTVTSGFRSMGQGRYVHPRRRRTITPHEAARLQFIPDFFDFSKANKTALAELIGNAVPPKLSYAIMLEMLR